MPVTSTRPRALLALSRHVVRTTPWATLFAGCVTGTAILWLLRYAAQKGHWAVDQNTMRFTVLPAIAALAFIPHTAFRPIVDATPVPAWLASAGQTIFTIPVLALTCWVQLLLISPRTAPGVIAHPHAIYPLLAQIAGWCALTIALAACTDRSRYADLGGAVAAPVSLALIALSIYGPKASHLLATPPAGPHAVTIAWWTIAAAMLAVTYAAMSDRWHRYTRTLLRPS